MADRTVVVRYRADESDLVRGSAAGGAAVKGAFTGAEQSGKSLQKTTHDVGLGLLAVGAAAGVGVAQAIGSWSAFDQQMSAVEAATHESAAGMGILTDATLAAGAASQFSATQAGQGVEELAKAGVATADIVGGALAGSLDLAAAGGLAVADSAQTMATALSVFNLEGGQAAHVADLLAAGAGKAQGSVSDMAAALNQSALVANQVGLSIEDTTGALAEFANAGLIGSDAGTSFRTMLLRLINPSVEAAGVMSELGISVYDNQGRFAGLESIAGQLQERMGGLDEETRNAALATIFGADAVRAASVLYEDGSEGVAHWRDEVNDAGYAAETARIMTDNLAGDLERLGGAFETAMIKIGSGADGPLRSLAQGLTGAVDMIGNLDPVAQTAILAVGGLTAGLGLLGGSALLLIPRIAATRTAMIELGVTANTLKGALAGLGQAAVVLGFAYAASEVTKAIGEWENIIPNVEDLTAALDHMARTGEVTGELADVFGEDLEKLGEIASRSSTGFNHWVDSLEGNYVGIKRVDDALAEMVNSGRGDEAAKIFDEIADAAARQGGTFQNTTERFRAYTEAAEAAGIGVGSFREKALEAADAVRFQRDGIEGLGGPMRVAAEVSDDLAASYQTQLENIPELNDEQSILAERFGLTAQSAIDLSDAMADVKRQQDILTGATVSAIEGQIGYEAALDDADQKFHDLIESGGTLADVIDEATGSFDLNTEAGRTAAETLIDIRDRTLTYADSVYTATGNEEDYRDIVAQGRQALIDKGIQYGLTKTQAEAYADSILAIPEKRTTTMTFDDAYARQKAGEFGSLVDWLVRNRTIRVGIEYTGGGPLEGLGAEGAFVPHTPGGQRWIVGEGTENEWILPQSKLDGLLEQAYGRGMSGKGLGSLGREALDHGRGSGPMIDYSVITAARQPSPPHIVINTPEGGKGSEDHRAFTFNFGEIDQPGIDYIMRLARVYADTGK